MVEPKFDLDKYNKIEVVKLIWDTFADFARSSDPSDISKYFSLEGENSILFNVFDRCRDAELIPQFPDKYGCPPLTHMVRKVFYSALNLNLIQPDKPDQQLGWGQNFGCFHFTTEGIKYFSEGFISVDDPGYLGKVLLKLKERISTIEDGQIELLLEAQRCLKAGCFRAAMVVIGVANEDACIELLDAIPLNCNPPTSGSTLRSDWNNCCNPVNAFSARWKPGIRVLKGIKKHLRTPGKGEEWWQWWEIIPGSLYTLGEAVRLSRNSAAHNTDRMFLKAEIALLLSAMPIQLEMIANLTDFLKTQHSILGSINL